MSDYAVSRGHAEPAELTPHHLEGFITAHSIAARLVRDLGDTSTVPLAAAALGVGTEQIIKSLLFLVKLPGQATAPQPVLVISSGERRVDHRAIAARFGVSRKKVELAPPEVVLTLLGYPAGGVPPFGHRTRVAVILDAATLALPDGDGALVYGGGGDDRTMLEISVGELRRVLQPEVLDVSRAEPTPPRAYG